MAIVCIDAGNSLVKAALMEHAVALSSAVFAKNDDEALKSYIRSLSPVEGGIVCSVGKPIDDIASLFPRCIELTEHTALPVTCDYLTPSTLGKDRLAAAVGAYTLYPEQDVLVIDAGTAITFDFVDRTGHYRGGNISPGLMMRFRALHDYTQSLPLLSPSEEQSLTGSTTEAAIVNGVQNGIIFEVEQYVSRFAAMGWTIVMTGGDTNFFVKKLKKPIFAESNLIFIGLEKIFQYNTKR